LATAVEKRVAAHLWTGILLVVAIALLVLLAGGYLRRQMRISMLKSDLTTTVSHELKTPLASMRALADTLLAGNYRDENQLREYLQLIAAENARLSRLIENFLTFSRIERNGQSFTFADVNVKELVDAAIRAAGERFDAEDCRLEVEIAPDLPRIRADGDALVMALVNLLDNAYKYSAGERRIAVRVYTAEANVCLEVEDNGAGMSRRTAKRIFERFHQADRQLSRKTGGCGLGLGIVKHIVGAHGGTIGVDSQPGRGSTFTVRLPFSRDASARKP
jgi:signal transduction histidine kinase